MNRNIFVITADLPPFYLIVKRKIAGGGFFNGCSWAVNLAVGQSDLAK